MPYKNREDKKKFQREWLSQRRADFFKDKSCVNCGSKENLELDHIDRTQKVSHRIWSWSKERRDNETAKCQALCGSCHTKKTRIDMGWDLEDQEF